MFGTTLTFGTMDHGACHWHLWLTSLTAFEFFSNLREQAGRVTEINAVVVMWPKIGAERGEL